MQKPINVRPFTGMSNVRQTGGLPERGGPHSPHVLLNADPTQEGTARARKGLRLVVPLPDPHSLWACKTFMLCMSQGSLYRLDQSPDPTLVAAIPVGPELRMYYVMDGDTVYLSNGLWQGAYRNGALTSWSAPVQTVTPDIILQDGSLRAGLYRLCFVEVDADGLFHSPGPWSEWDIPDGKGVLVTNRPAGCRVCMTDPDGHVFYVQDGDLIVMNENKSPLPTFENIPFPPARHLRKAFGRMWGADGSRVLYSDPYRYDLARRESYLEFGGEVVMLMPTEQGLYVGTADVVYFLAGTAPEAMSMSVASTSGAITGQQAYVSQIPEIGTRVPVWGSKDGVMVGTHSGQVVPATKSMVKIQGGVESALVEAPGQPLKILASVRRPGSDGVGVGDHVTAEVVRNGKIV